MNTGMPVGARRVFRAGFVMALSLAGAYGLQLPLPYISPIFALMLSLKPGPAVSLKGFLALVLLILLTTGIGLLLIPVLDHYPLSGLLIVGMGVFLANYLSVNKGKGAVGSLLTVGLTLLTAAGLVSFAVALFVIKGLVMGVILAILCQHLVYPFFPEPAAGERVGAQPPPEEKTPSNWIALRATLIVMPAYFLALTNPALYMPLIMKSVSLGQQGSITDARHAGRELLGSTFMGGLLAILFWLVLGLWPVLWMFGACMLVAGIFLVSRIYRICPSRYPPPFWINAGITMLILLGPAVEDSANGKDVYMAFAVRMGLFVAVTLYAWMAVALLEFFRNRQRGAILVNPHEKETVQC